MALKKRLSLGDFPRLPNTVGPGNKKTVTKQAKCSIRWHPAFIGSQWGPLEIFPFLKFNSLPNGRNQRRCPLRYALRGRDAPRRLLSTAHVLDISVSSVQLALSIYIYLSISVDVYR